MKRLTKRIDGEACFHECTGTCGTCDGAMCFCVQPMVDRLAAYEDTELTPDAAAQLKQIAEIFNCDPNDPAQLKQICDKLRGWQQADQDGRLVVLPCKIGDVVWTIKNFKGHKKARCGCVSEMFYTKYMKLFIVVKNAARGFWGEGVFPSEAEAAAAMEQREKEVAEHG